MCWRRLMCVVWPCHCREHDTDRTDELFAANLVAQERVGIAASEVTRASDAQRERIETARGVIQQRTRAREASRSSPPTSEAREQVDALVARLEMRSGRRGP